mmetsp:Transcript_41162/g.77131  ORF Transcript_41162/g.77131 Transcript_41162/m.77131 type:complete len:200 (-) Transcript_41162:561-1160(-)
MPHWVVFWIFASSAAFFAAFFAAFCSACKAPTVTPPVSATRARSYLDPRYWPRMAQLMVAAMAYLGSSADFRISMMRGMLACTATNHAGENFSRWSRHMPSGTLDTRDVAAVAAIRMLRSWGRSARMGAVAANAARILMMAEGHFIWIVLMPYLAVGFAYSKPPSTSLTTGILLRGHLLTSTSDATSTLETSRACLEGG